MLQYHMVRAHDVKGTKVFESQFGRLHACSFCVKTKKTKETMAVLVTDIVPLGRQVSTPYKTMTYA